MFEGLAWHCDPPGKRSCSLGRALKSSTCRPKFSVRVRLMDIGRIDKSDPNDFAAVVARRVRLERRLGRCPPRVR